MIKKRKLLVDIGDRIRKRRLELKWSQEYFANEICVSPSYVSHLESGNRSMSLDVLVNVANVLNLSLEYLITGITPVSDQGRVVLGDDLLYRLKEIFNKPDGDALRRVISVLVDGYKYL